MKNKKKREAAIDSELHATEADESAQRTKADLQVSDPLKETVLAHLKGTKANSEETERDSTTRGV